MRSSTDREADEYELALHRKSALRGWLIGGALTALGTVLFLATGYAQIGILFIPGAVAIGNALTHRQKANAIAARLAAPAHAYGVVTWTDGASYAGHVLEMRGGHVLVQFDSGKQDWTPAAQVRAS